MFTFFFFGAVFMLWIMCFQKIEQKLIFLMAHVLKKWIHTVKNMRPSGFNG